MIQANADKCGLAILRIAVDLELRIGTWDLGTGSLDVDVAQGAPVARHVKGDEEREKGDGWDLLSSTALVSENKQFCLCALCKVCLCADAI